MLVLVDVGGAGALRLVLLSEDSAENPRLKGLLCMKIKSNYCIQVFRILLASDLRSHAYTHQNPIKLGAGFRVDSLAGGEV